MTIKSYQNLSSKNLKDKCIGINIKQKVRKEARPMNKDISLNKILLESINCMF